VATRGRPPRPTSLKVVHGTRSDRVNTAEPQLAEQPIVPPHELSPEAQASWDRLAPDPDRQGLLDPLGCRRFAAPMEAVLRTAHNKPAGVWRSVVGSATSWAHSSAGPRVSGA
jgi:hypothetical protein